MGKATKIEPRTLQFIEALEKLKKANKLPSNQELAMIMGIRTPATISEIKRQKQNIQPESWEKFQNHFGQEISFTVGEPSVPYGLNNELKDMLEIIKTQSQTINLQQQTIFNLVNQGNATGSKRLSAQSA